MTLATLLRQLQQQHYPQSANDFAKALGVRASHLSRAMRTRNAQPFDVLGCLRLAEVTGTDPILVLRAAGKDRIADKLIRLGLPLRKEGLSPAARELLDVLNYLTTEQIRHLTVIARHIARLPTTPPVHKRRASLPKSTVAESTEKV